MKCTIEYDLSNKCVLAIIEKLSKIPGVKVIDRSKKKEE